ncbi:MAG: transcriptional repressor [Candidatus Sumerlaeia bacterium]|nr:transcriptional repressor [Candidatus Sumerlaeia bacterium]
MTALRRTTQKQAVQQALEQAGQPMTPQQLCGQARQQVPGLGLATVYRLLRGLLDQGEARRVEIPGHPPMYELAPPGCTRHFVCQQCQRITTLPAPARSTAGNLPPGYALDAQQVILWGRCPECQ